MEAKRMHEHAMETGQYASRCLLINGRNMIIAVARSRSNGHGSLFPNFTSSNPQSADIPQSKTLWIKFMEKGSSAG
jgi:hypothetical protein